LWSNYKHLTGHPVALDELMADLHANWHITLMIERRDNQTVGFIYSYEAQFVDGYCFVTTFIDKRFQRRGYGALAHGLFLDYLLTYFSFNKIYTDVYGYNEHSLQTVENSGYAVEGRFPMHRYHNGAYHEMIRLAFYRTQHPGLRQRLARFSGDSTEGRV
jgi:RimJ/RimL family protein N-acetyltransferase